MPVFHALTGSPALAGESVGRSAPTQTGNFFPAQTTTLVDGSSGWGPLPTDDRNRPDSAVIVVLPYPTPAFDPLLPASTQENSISTAELVGITISAGVVALTVLFAVIWWMRRRSRIGHRLGSESQRSLVVEKGEEPPTYEAAVFGVRRDAQLVCDIPIYTGNGVFHFF